MKDLRQRTARAAVARLCAQAANLLLRVISLGVLARLLEPKDFGLVSMVTALTGVLNLLRDFGLSAASVQSPTVSEEQKTTLFWINVLFGATLAGTGVALAPLVSAFYQEPRVYWVTVVIATTFLFNAAGIQHAALLQRQMRFTALSLIDTGSWIVSTSVAILAAKAGFGYWSLVAMTVTLPIASTAACWLATAWVPGMPRRGTGIRRILRFGGTITINGLVIYAASNFEKVLLGRFWGADAIGIYGRAYQLIRLPTDTLNGAVGEVAFSALSRLQDDHKRLKGFFLTGYSLVIGLTLPATCACCVFASDLIALLLGPKWNDAAPIFRLLTPTILVYAIANPLGWLLGAIGMVERGLKMSLAMAPFIIAANFVGLPYGPKGVAVANSTVMTLWLMPVIAWSVHGTVISLKDVMIVISGPLASVAVAGILALGATWLCGPSHLIRLVIGGLVLSGSYAGMLLCVMGQKSFYTEVVKKIVRRGSVEEEALSV